MFLRDSDRLHFKHGAQVFESGYLGQVDLKKVILVKRKKKRDVENMKERKEICLDCSILEFWYLKTMFPFSCEGVYTPTGQHKKLCLRMNRTRAD
jgi:hypothetical protein